MHSIGHRGNHETGQLERSQCQMDTKSHLIFNQAIANKVFDSISDKNARQRKRYKTVRASLCDVKTIQCINKGFKSSRDKIL